MKFEEWQTLTLDNLYEFGSGLSKPRKEFGFGYPFLTFKEVFHNIFLPQTLNELVNSTEKEQVKCSIKKGDVFLTRTSEKLEELGMSSVALKNYDNATFNGFTKRLRPKQGTNDILIPEYVAFYFRSPKFRNQINSMATMTTRASLNNSMLQRLTIDIPPIDIQRQIIQILNSILQKEELNLKIISTIEELAQTLFKRWFVDFEFPNEEGKPYKSSGGKMVESELGMIPQGWSEGVLKGITLNLDRKRVPLSKLEREKRDKIYPYYGAASLMDYVDDYIFDGIYVLVGEDGTVTDDKGYPILQYVWGKLWVNNHAHVLQGKNNFTTEFIYLLLKRTNVSNIVTGAVQPKINQTNLNKIPVIIPNENVLDQFNEIISSVFTKIRKIKDENNSLEKLRDTLLPKLLSGEIELPDDMEVTDDVSIS